MDDGIREKGLKDPAALFIDASSSHYEMHRAVFNFVSLRPSRQFSTIAPILMYVTAVRLEKHL